MPETESIRFRKVSFQNEIPETKKICNKDNIHKSNPLNLQKNFSSISPSSVSNNSSMKGVLSNVSYGNLRSNDNFMSSISVQSGKFLKVEEEKKTNEKTFKLKQEKNGPNSMENLQKIKKESLNIETGKKKNFLFDLLGTSDFALQPTQKKVIEKQRNTQDHEKEKKKDKEKNNKKERMRKRLKNVTEFRPLNVKSKSKTKKSRNMKLQNDNQMLFNNANKFTNFNQQSKNYII